MVNEEKQDNERANLKEQYYFFLNNYPDMAFTKCPKCKSKTRQKKMPLIIRFGKEDQVMSLNKTCRYCPRCELLIAKEEEINYIIGRLLGREAKKQDYRVVGTMEAEAWKKGMGERDEASAQAEGVSVFKGVWTFDVKPAGWYFEGVK